MILQPNFFLLSALLVGWVVSEEGDDIDAGATGTGSSPTGNATTTVDNEGVIDSDESESSDTRSLWLAHGILLGIAWGIFAPLAIGAAYLRNMKCLKNNALWLRLHFGLNSLVAVLTVCGFSIAVAAIKQDDDLPHFVDDVHRKAGLAIFLLVVIQAAAGYFRPGLPHGPPKVAGGSTVSARPASSSQSPNLARQSVQTVEDSMLEDDQKIAIAKATPSQTNKDSGSLALPPQKSRLRQFWEYVHRFLGMTLLGLSWYNCQSGIIFLAEKYDQYDEQKLLNIFWGITGGIAGMIFLVGYVIRME